MKKVYTLILAASLLLGASAVAQAVEFKAKGNWQFGFGVGDGNFVEKVGNRRTNADDKFKARQRLRMSFDAVVSEALSGTLGIEIGHQNWGRAAQGGALGTDGNQVKVRWAYMDWAVPNTDLKFRMGLQNMNLPKAAGGGQVLYDADMGAVVASYAINDTVGLSAFWARPFNDNYAGDSAANNQHYLDNMDLFALTLPLTFEGAEITPWVMYGMRGKNTFNGNGKLWADGNPSFTLSSNPMGGNLYAETSKAYGSMFWAGLPMKITAIDPLNIEFELNYGWVEQMGRYDMAVRNGQSGVHRASTQRDGWIAKALVEYKMDWGIPGIFGWYASGDDGNLKNGSERMPSVDPYGTFTSFMGDATMYGGGWVDLDLSYAGSWGLGLQMRNIQFIDDLQHVVRAAYWGGTNSTSMVKYFGGRRDGWNAGTGNAEGPYLTTSDGLLEINVNSTYKIYENLKAGLELGYIVNMMNKDLWQSSDRSYLGQSFAKQDAWKANLIFQYSF